MVPDAAREEMQRTDGSRVDGKGYRRCARGTIVRDDGLPDVSKERSRRL